MKKILIIAFVIFIAQNIYAQQKFKPITIADLWEKWTFWASSVDGFNSMNDGEFYTILEENKIVKYSYKTGKKISTILDFSQQGFGYISEYTFSDNESKILFYSDVERLYRWSFKAKYYIWDSKTQKVEQLSENGKQQLATFSPDGNAVAFVRDNNLFVKLLTNGTETQITTDGKYNEIINGAPDWVYEEEFGFNKAFEWSADSKKIAYIRFDESKVKMFGMSMFAGLAPKNTDNKLYPQNYTFKYPKAGEDNSLVSVHIYNIENKSNALVDIGSETDIYIPRIRWTKNPDILSIIRLNRLQNKLEILLANKDDGKTKVIYTDENKYYIEESVLDALTFLPDNKHFVITSEKDGYRHLYLYTIQGNFVTKLTSGEWDVISFLGFDEISNRFYYQSAEESPMQRTVYSVDAKGKKQKITNLKGTNKTTFSKGYKYYINEHSSINTPTLVTLHSIDGKQLRILEDNSALKSLVKEYGGVNKHFFRIKTSENIELNAIMIKPPDFDSTKKYPVLITQYNGPNSQEVLDNWSFGWEELLAQKNYIVVSVDTRGTGARGQEFRKCTYLQLGKYETIDLIESAKYLGKLSYIDSYRIGIWGWSYGGYMTLLCMTKGAEFFKTGIAIAPVTNWRYYDNIYTERFMRKPQDNADGYDSNSPINHVNKFQGRLLICHGSADDNVHLQNTMEFAEAMVQAEKQFQMMIYNNRNHSIYGGKTRTHLYTMLTNYILENL